MATDMRLRLIIRRHGLPEVRLVWPCPASDGLIVASLLSQVNEVVTLESGQWGLEDYAVELADDSGGSFECLHFQPVGKLLKQDDQVIIRSLLTEDLRQRRISGRHQISDDGIHLVDGIPFGRRRGPRDRPSLVLPPRKRARITYDSSQDEEEEELSRLLLEDTPRPNDEDDSDGDEDFNHDDYSDNDEEDDADDDLEEELQTLQAESEGFGPPVLGSRGRREGGAVASSSQLLKLEGMNPAALVALRAAFPLLSSSALEAKLDAHGSNLEATYKDLASTNDPELNYNGMMTIFMQTRFNHVSPPEPALLPETPRHRHKKPLIQVIEDTEAEEESTAVSPVHKTFGSLQPPESSSSSSDSSTSDESDSESADEPEPAPSKGSDGSSSESDDSDSDDDQGGFQGFDDSASSDSDSTSEAGGTANKSVRRSKRFQPLDSERSNDSSDDSMRGMSNGDASVQETKASNTLIQDVTGDASADQNSSSDDDAGEDDQEALADASNNDDSSNDSSNDATSVNFKETLLKSLFKEASLSGSSDDSDDQSSDTSDSSESSSDDQQEPATVVFQAQKPSTKAETSTVVQSALAKQQNEVGRGQGLSRTQKRNARRRLAKEKHQEQKQVALDPTMQGEADEIPADLEGVSLSQKRAELSKAINDAQVASSDDSSSSAAESSSDSSSDSGPDEETTARKDSRPKIEVVETVDVEEPAVATPGPPGEDLAQTLLRVDGSGLPMSTPNAASSAKDESARKRMRVDMGAGRRMLFGALGLKNPKSKSEEEKLKRDLMKDVRPHQNHRQKASEEAVEKAAEPEAEPQAEEEDDWREKITYRAVECCYEGMVLSEPPFPFAQRWDPQQQYGAMRKRKRDSQHFEEYYDEESWHGEQENGSSKKKKKNKKRASKHDDAQDEYNNNGGGELNYDDAPSNTEAADTQVTDLDDLPSLPADPNALSSVTLDNAKAGMVIAWQRLELSKATNWQPQVQWVTGMIISKASDKIHLILAKRDREADDRVYDEDGNRMYDKFEIPEDDDLEEYKPDDGHREMSWSDLSDARLVQGEPSPSMLNSPTRESFEGPDPELLARSLASSLPPASSINDVDSMQVRAEMEDEMMDAANGGDHEASSIPHGQTHVFMQPIVEEPSHDTASEERSQPGIIIKDSQNAKPANITDQSRQDSLDERVAATDDNMDVVAGVDYEKDDQELDPHETPLVYAAHASSQPDAHKEQTPSIDYPQLPVPSSASSLRSSLRSGRQPQSNMAEPGNDDQDVTPVPESEPSALPELALPEEARSRRRSSNSFPALDETWHTAKTSKTQRSPLKSSQGSALVEKTKLKVEPGLSSQRSTSWTDRNSSRNLFPNATQPELPATSPQSPRRSSRRLSKSTPFVVPEGSQIITLSSSPVSEKSAVSYAEDGLNGTNEDPPSSALPKGRGRVSKNKSARGRPRRVSSR